LLFGNGRAFFLMICDKFLEAFNQSRFDLLCRHSASAILSANFCKSFVIFKEEL
jgi:hypothetical protein